jgi:hypothetical protein
MRYEYRIKVEEKNNGQKSYIPQVGELKLSLGKYCYVWKEWLNIICDNYGLDGFGKPSKTITYSYDSEKVAMNIIERYKQYLCKRESNKVNKVSYININ